MTETRTITQEIRIVVAAGGTGGHVQPAIATLKALGKRGPYRALWLGTGNALERQAAHSVAAEFRRIQTGKLRRYVSLRTGVDTVRIPVGVVQSLWHIRRFRPDIVLSTGGFASVPPIIAAKALRVPSVTHEQTAIAGLATRINARFTDVIALSYEASLRHLPGYVDKVVVTGNPVRGELFHGDASAVYERFGLTPELPLIYVTGGALGAHAVNAVVAEVVPNLLPEVQIIHQCGPTTVNNNDEALLNRIRRGLPENLQERYIIRPFIGPELADVYAAAVLVIGRAGAGTVAELAALGKPSILIPLPGTGGDEQTENARRLAEAGASVLIPQRDLTGERLEREIRWMLHGNTLTALGAAARTLGNVDAADRLVDLLIDLVRRQRANVHAKTA